jgi:hypothetical protein
MRLAKVRSSRGSGSRQVVGLVVFGLLLGALGLLRYGRMSSPETGSALSPQDPARHLECQSRGGIAVVSFTYAPVKENTISTSSALREERARRKSSSHIQGFDRMTVAEDGSLLARVGDKSVAAFEFTNVGQVRRMLVCASDLAPL